jgi:outer membrane lipoprotein-sorting protein
VPLLAAVALWLLAAGSASAKDVHPRDASLSAPQRVEALLTRVKHQQEGIETLTAQFVQRQDSEFLVESKESRGQFYYQAPDQVLWEYQAPDPMTILIDRDTMTSWYRDLGRAERLHIGKQSERILKQMGAGGSMADLEEYFDIAAAFPKDASLPYRLELTPRYERIARRLRSITIWVDPESFLPQRFIYVDGDGDRTEFQFAEMKVNGELSAGLFKLEMPSDVEVKEVDLDTGSAP